MKKTIYTENVTILHITAGVANLVRPAAEA